MFVDRVRIELQAGKGGDGCMSFRREKYVPKGGPDGGDGGDGASIIFEARLGVDSLAGFVNRRFIRAKNGQPGQGSMRHGRRGKDERYYVPPGTTVIDAEHGFVIKDLLRPKEQCVVARGGKGGHGNAHFKSSTNQAPRERTLGEEGESRAIVLELKSIADVGLVGMPNAGKSTLLSRVSSARPQIGDYPFTTKTPNLGLVEQGVERSFVLADIPGLIEGASEGVGLGHAFLRHIERAGLLIHLVEPMPIDGTDPVDNYRSIRAELSEYEPSLKDREEMVVVSKAELPNSGEIQRRLEEVTGRDVMRVSAATGEGLGEFIARVMERVDARRSQQQDAGEEILASRPADDEFRTRKTQRRRLPPHRAGPTAQLSDELQAKDYDSELHAPADDDATSPRERDTPGESDP